MPESDVDSNTSRRHKKSKTSATPAERQQPESGGNHLLRVLLSDPRSVKIVMEWLDDNPPNLYHTQLRNFESTKAELDRLKDKLRSQERSRKDASTYQQRWTLLERLAHRSEDGGAEERDWLDMARWSRGLYPLLLALQSDEGSRRPSVVPSSTTHTSAMHTALNGGEQLTSRIQTLVSDAGQPPCYVILGDLSEDPLEPVAFIFDVDFPTKFLKDPVSSTHDARVTQSVLRILAIQQRVADGPSVSQPADIVPLLIEMDAHDHIPDHYLDRSINQPPIASDNTRQLPILWGIVKCPEDWAVLIHVDRQYHEITIYSIEDRPNKQAVIIRELQRILGKGKPDDDCQYHAMSCILTRDKSLNTENCPILLHLARILVSIIADADAYVGHVTARYLSENVLVPRPQVYSNDLRCYLLQMVIEELEETRRLWQTLRADV